MAKLKRQKKDRCNSCKKLKIKCDGVKPSCEYCSATGRSCEYQTAKAVRSQQIVPIGSHSLRYLDPESAMDSLFSMDSSVVSSPSSVSSVSDIQIGKDVPSQMKSMLYDMSLKIMQGMQQSPKFLWDSSSEFDDIKLELGLSDFEAQLLQVYNDYDATYRNLNRSSTVVDGFVPEFWRSSSLVRNSVYCMALLYLWDGHKFENSDTTSALKSLLTEKVYEYSLRTIQYSNEVVGNLASYDDGKNDVRAAEVVVGAVLLFTFLMLQPFDILPLVSFEPGAISVLSLVRSLSTIMGDCFQVVFQSKYRNLLFLCDVIGTPLLSDSYPVVKILNSCLQSQKDHLDVDKIFVYKNTLEKLNLGIHRTITESQPSNLYRWIFIIDEATADCIQNQEYFGLKLLYYYSCMSLLLGLRMSRKRSVFIEFCKWYRQWNHDKYGGWHDVHDEGFYKIVVDQGYQTTSPQFGFLVEFNPLTFDVPTPAVTV